MRLTVPPHFLHQQWMMSGLSLEVVTENEWWRVDNSEISGNVSVPSWWDAIYATVVVSTAVRCDDYVAWPGYRTLFQFRWYLWLASRSWSSWFRGWGRCWRGWWLDHDGYFGYVSLQTHWMLYPSISCFLFYSHFSFVWSKLLHLSF